jgi:hypothetical protein
MEAGKRASAAFLLAALVSFKEAGSLFDQTVGVLR